MRTVQLQESHGAPEVAEHHEILPQDRDAQRQVAQFVGKANRLPEAAQVFPARRSGAYMREFCVFLWGHRDGSSRQNAWSRKGLGLPY